MGKIKKKLKYLFFSSGSKVETLPDGSGYFCNIIKKLLLSDGQKLNLFISSFGSEIKI